MSVDRNSLEEEMEKLLGHGNGIIPTPSSTAVAINMRAEYERQKIERMMQQWPGAIYNGPEAQVRIPPRAPSNHEMLCMRMRWDPQANIACFGHVAVYSAGEKVFVWVITKDHQAVTIEDEAGLFPSDALVTKLRMLQQGT